MSAASQISPANPQELRSLAVGARFRVGSRVGVVLQHRGAVVEVRVGTQDPHWCLATMVVEPISGEAA